MTPDPIAGSIADPQSLNRYAYTRNDPVNLVDPTGLLCSPTYARVRIDVLRDAETGEIVDITGVTVVGFGGYVCSFFAGSFRNFIAEALEKLKERLKEKAKSVNTDGKEAAAEFCRERGQISFNIPFTDIEVSMSGSFTAAYASFATTNDIGLVFGTFPPLFPSLGAGVDISIGAPDPNVPQALVFVGSGRNLSIGTFLTPEGMKGFSASFGPSTGAEIGVALPVTNLCGLVQGASQR